jgi:hypothetical protein
MHPLVTNLSEMKDHEISSKISDLTKKYYMTRNPDVQWQIAGVLDDLRLELRQRTAKQMQNAMNNGKQNLDSLIKVS